MLYVGITVSIQEAFRLLGITPVVDAPSASTDALIAARTSLCVFTIDKGVCVLGLEVPHIHRNYQAPIRSVDECVNLILLQKHEWLREVARLKLDMQAVKIAHMEEEDEVVENPQPALFTR